jgi:pyruvate dehydrogenase E2 component (dihydrolipoamide acetyltransferase)
MAIIVRMPEVLANSAEGAVAAWMVAEGDSIAIGQPLAEIETEKAMVEYASEVEGVLVKLLVQAGDSIAVGEPIGVIAAVGESDVDVASLLAGASADPPSPTEGSEDAAPTTATPITGTAAVDAAPVATAASASATPASTASDAAPARSSNVGSAPAPVAHGRLFASPLARRLAKEKNLDLTSITGTGPNGRIVRRDLEGAVAPTPVVERFGFGEPTPVAESVGSSGSQPAPSVPAEAAPSGSAAAFTDVPHTGMRRAIARRLTESKSTVPHFYLVADCRVDALLSLRSQVNSASTRKISVNDFVVKAVAGALVEIPGANAIWTPDASRRFSSVDIAIAVSTDGGLLTPVLRGVERLGLQAISESIAELAGRAREGRLRQPELEGGSFAISNLGMYGVDEFSAILNPPQSGILAVGAAKQRAIVVEGELVVGTVMTVTLSADHRVVDGALGALWLAAFVKRIENPLSILI